MSKVEKIGVGIITCNRPDFLNNLLSSISACKIDNCIVINDGREIENLKISSNFKYIHNSTNIGVCKSKNKAMNYLLEEGSDYIFIIEDDMKIKDINIFTEYINAYKKTGIQHMMFGYHGPANKGNISYGKPQPRKIFDYGDIKIALNGHCVGSFCFYTRESLVKEGLYDEEFDKNNFEHVEHSYRLAKAGYSTPYWWWADLANSTDFIEEQACSEDSTAIRRGKREDWIDKLKWSALLFQKKHGYMPAWENHVPDTSVSEVISILKNLKQIK
jgi:GT2 family glycosyltransferase